MKREEAVVKLRASRRQLYEALAGMSDEDLVRPNAVEKWTVKDLLALPVSRLKIVLSKFIVAGIWCIILSLTTLILGLFAGFLVQLSGWSSSIALSGFKSLAIGAGLTILLCSPVAFFAGYGRGYLPPLGFMILMIILAQFISALGYGPYFPWAVPAMLAGAAGPENTQLGSVSYIIVLLTSLAGIVATSAWWRYADQA